MCPGHAVILGKLGLEALCSPFFMERQDPPVVARMPGCQVMVVNQTSGEQFKQW